MHNAFRLAICFLVLSNSLFADPLLLEEKNSKPPVNEIASVTEHTATINGVAVSYKATTGTLQQKNDKGDIKASLFYVAYSRSDVEDSVKRPIAFCFNGGPGAASVWLHMGLLGPKRVNLAKEAPTIPPYGYGNNEYSLLDVVDLVFIDPVSTGYSRTAPNEDPKQFHGVDEDIQSVAEFIRLYTTQNSRWESPKFLIGESYGTTRAALLVDHLHEQCHMYFNGLILVSSVLDFQTIDKMERSNDLTYLLYLPSYTAAAWYHKKLPADLQKDMLSAIEESKTFAIDEYSLALLKGDKLPPEKRQEIVKKLARYTGIGPDFIERMNLRISLYTFLKELLREENRVIGRFDSRLTGIDLDPCSAVFNHDPSMDSVLGAFTATFNQYVRNDLRWTSDEEYQVLSNVFPWNYGKANNVYLNSGTALRTAMSRNPFLKVFVANGYFDLATPQFATEYTFSHMDLALALRSHVTMGYYEGGHLMFTDMPSLVKLSKDLHTFVSDVMKTDLSR